MKILLLFLTIALSYSGNHTTIQSKDTLAIIYQPTLVDALDPTRPRLV